MLHQFQQEILDIALQKKTGALSIPMGSGKTLISLKLAFELTNNIVNSKILIVAAKSLIGSWEIELKKWFPNIKYYVLSLIEPSHNDLQINQIFITTPSTLVKYYKYYKIEDLFVVKFRESDFCPEINHYHHLTEPLLKNKNLFSFYSINFDVLIVDEAHNYFNIETLTCRALCSIYSKYRWLLSGTILSEPKITNILGFHKILNDPLFPNNLPETKIFVESDNFKGIKSKIIHRKNNDMFTNKPNINKKILDYQLSSFENKIFILLKNIIKETYDILVNNLDNPDIQKIYNARLLTLILMVRLSLINPILCLSKVFLSFIDSSNFNSLNSLIISKINELNINQELEQKKNLYSFRITETINIINNHPNERIIIYSNFRIVLDFLQPLLPNNRKYYTINPNYSHKKRTNMLEKFENESDNGVLLITYSIGAEGLNLQFATCMIFIDVWWNESKTKQAIARIYRFGQKNDVSVYMFFSNTYIEKNIFDKHRDKASMIESLFNGKTNGSITKINRNQIVNMITYTDNDLIQVQKSF